LELGRTSAFERPRRNWGEEPHLWPTHPRTDGDAMGEPRGGSGAATYEILRGRRPTAAVRERRLRPRTGRPPATVPQGRRGRAEDRTGVRRCLPSPPSSRHTPYQRPLPNPGGYTRTGREPSTMAAPARRQGRGFWAVAARHEQASPAPSRGGPPPEGTPGSQWPPKAENPDANGRNVEKVPKFAESLGCKILVFILYFWEPGAYCCLLLRLGTSQKFAIPLP